MASGPLVVFTFPEYNLNKYQWIFTKLGTCDDIVETFFLIANGFFTKLG